MGTIMVLLLLGWLACTAVLTIGIGSGDPGMRSNEIAARPALTFGEDSISPSAMGVTSAPTPESPPSPAAVD